MSESSDARDARLAELGIDVSTWPPPSPAQIERLRHLFGYAALAPVTPRKERP